MDEITSQDIGDNGVIYQAFVNQVQIDFLKELEQLWREGMLASELVYLAATHVKHRVEQTSAQFEQEQLDHASRYLARTD